MYLTDWTPPHLSERKGYRIVRSSRTTDNNAVVIVRNMQHEVSIEFDEAHAVLMCGEFDMEGYMDHNDHNWSPGNFFQVSDSKFLTFCAEGAIGRDLKEMNVYLVCDEEHYIEVISNKPPQVIFNKITETQH